jgi:hypothetical protein
VRWTAADGSTHTDEARVPVRSRAGSTVTVWTDGNGRIVADPLTEGDARLHAISGGVLVGMDEPGGADGCGCPALADLSVRGPRPRA